MPKFLEKCFSRLPHWLDSQVKDNEHINGDIEENNEDEAPPVVFFLRGVGDEVREEEGHVDAGEESEFVVDLREVQEGALHRPHCEEEHQRAQWGVQLKGKLSSEPKPLNWNGVKKPSHEEDKNVVKWEGFPYFLVFKERTEFLLKVFAS